MAFARAGANGKRRFTPPKQANFMAAVKLFAAKKMGSKPLMEGPLKAEIIASYSVPESWSKRKKDTTKWKTSKPDADNIAKLILDSLNGVVFNDDAQVCDLYVRKVYGVRSCIVVSIRKVEE